MTIYLVSNHLDEYERVDSLAMDGIFDNRKEAEQHIYDQIEPYGYSIIWSLDVSNRIWKRESEYFYNEQAKAWVTEQ